MEGLYKTLIDRERSGMNVGAVIWKRARGTARRLKVLLEPELREGEEMPDLELLQELMRRALERRRKELVEAGEELVTARGEVIEQTAATETAVAGARRDLIDLRNAFRGHFGTEAAANFLGVRGDTSSDPIPLQTQIDRAVARLRNAERPLPASRIRLATPDREELADGLAGRAKTLFDAWNGLGLARKEAEATLVVKNQALARWNDLFLKIARVFEAVYLLIGCNDWAREVRPSGHRKGRTAVDVMRRRKKKPRKNKKRQQPVAEDAVDAAGRDAGEEAAASSLALVVRRPEAPSPPEEAPTSGLRRVLEVFKPSRRAG